MSAELHIRDDARDRHRRAILAVANLVIVVMTGTIGFCLIEGWPLWKSFYFTLITITTVGYGDEGISDEGAQFAAFLLIFGIAMASYAFATLVQLTVAREFAWRRRMQSKIDKLRNHTIVCGFGRMSHSICEELTEAGLEFVIIDRDPDRVDSALSRNYLVMEGVATEDETLERAGIRHAGHLVAMTSPEDQNIVVSLTARELAPEITIISRAENPRDKRKLRRAGTDKVVSPYQSGGVTVANMIARPRVAELLSFQDQEGTDIALAEVPIEEGSPLIGQTLAAYGRDIAANVCFVALERPGEPTSIPPRGTVEIAADDVVIVAGDPEQVASMKESGRASLQRAAPDAPQREPQPF